MTIIKCVKWRSAEYGILPMGAFSDGDGRVINVKSHNGGGFYNGVRFYLFLFCGKVVLVR